VARGRALSKATDASAVIGTTGIDERAASFIPGTPKVLHIAFRVWPDVMFSLVDKGFRD
jgi:hypothetical protein